MIIKMTVNDNDFTTILATFAANMYSNVTSGVEVESLDIRQIRRLTSLMNPNEVRKLTKEDKSEIVERVKKSFSLFIDPKFNSRIYLTEETQEYLKLRLKVTVQESFKDKIENKESVYWLQHSNTVVVQ